VEKKALPHPEDAGNVVTISQGICWGIPSGYQKAWDYLRAADNNLYQVKQDSRNGIRIGTNEE
jgi:PleD family two-component response regulator